MLFWKLCIDVTLLTLVAEMKIIDISMSNTDSIDVISFRRILTMLISFWRNKDRTLMPR